MRVVDSSAWIEYLTGSALGVALAGELPEVVEPAYLAPELKDDPLQSSAASDVYAAGATLYELFTGKPTFENLDEALAATQVFPEKVSSLVTGLPEGFYRAWAGGRARSRYTDDAACR